MLKDIVYVWVNAGPHATTDLRYSLRSLEDNWLGQFQVTIVGDNPPGATGFWHLPMDRLPDPHLPKALDAVRKMQAICNARHIGERFAYWYDDVYLLRPVDTAFLERRVATQEITKDMVIKGGARKHAQQVLRTAQVLFDAGFKRVWNYETHTPRVFEKRKMQEVLDLYRPAGNRLLLPTLYFNHFHRNQEPHIISRLDDVKAGFYGITDCPRSFPPAPTTDDLKARDTYAQQCIGKAYLNHNDRGIDVGLQYLRHSLWPEPSSFELQDKLAPMSLVK
jgi:hypothetical protein